MTLSEYIMRLPDDRWLYIGTRGTKPAAGESTAGGGGWLIISRKCDLEETDWHKYADREVVTAYPHRFVPPLGISVLVEGREKGKYWSYEEKLKAEERKK